MINFRRDAMIRQDPTVGLVEFATSVKPYHSKILDVLVEYVYQETIDVSVGEKDWRMETQLTRSTVPAAFSPGYGFGWDVTMFPVIDVLNNSVYNNTVRTTAADVGTDLANTFEIYATKTSINIQPLPAATSTTTNFVLGGSLPVKVVLNVTGYIMSINTTLTTNATVNLPVGLNSCQYVLLYDIGGVNQFRATLIEPFNHAIGVYEFEQPAPEWACSSLGVTAVFVHKTSTPLDFNMGEEVELVTQNPAGAPVVVSGFYIPSPDPFIFSVATKKYPVRVQEYRTLVAANNPLPMRREVVSVGSISTIPTYGIRHRHGQFGVGNTFKYIGVASDSNNNNYTVETVDIIGADIDLGVTTVVLLRIKVGQRIAISEASVNPAFGFDVVGAAAKVRITGFGMVESGETYNASDLSVFSVVSESLSLEYNIQLSDSVDSTADEFSYPGYGDNVYGRTGFGVLGNTQIAPAPTAGLHLSQNQVGFDTQGWDVGLV